ncbi:von Willebrand factor A domain-containing protein 7-like isoform X2 [Paramacrobiotus metropolitanus]|uniref:von Willebrand factor A domain-containing protein 7-like isoform X2 n=1 Tax=Paramacrobiotus metropolitanus TaxID=2943436 RepID=UPI00244580BD|nr:von Willebrand factor A domain-containing protein 7-like isoform X2 [Paramacrobiotus metropolitanus]
MAASRQLTLLVFMATCTGSDIATAADQRHRSSPTQGTDMIFVVDVSHSMFTSMCAVRRVCLQLFSLASSSNNPGGFVLVPFHGDAVGPVQVFDHSGYGLPTAIDYLGAYGNSDTPQPCLEALLAASERGGNRAPIYVFTDAPPTNPGLLSSVLVSVLLKRQMVIFIVPTPEGNAIAAEMAVYQTIADVTSGQLITTTETMPDIDAAWLFGAIRR